MVHLKNLSRSAKLKVFGPELRILEKNRIHIQKRHAWMDLPINRSLFFPHIDTDKLVEKARRLPRTLQSNGNFVRVGVDKEYVGLDVVTKKPTRIYTVVTDPSDIDVVTEHPGLPDPKYSLNQ